MTATAPTLGGLHLGLPIWAHAPWRGSLYGAGAGRDDFLPQYGRVFNAVEGNSTFYAEPGRAVLERWRRQAPPGFEFCCKFPRRLTHDAALRGVEAEVEAFLQRMEVLEDRLGPFLIQLGPAFGRRGLLDLARLLEQLPPRHRYVVEVRHPDFFDGGDSEARLEVLLEQHGIDRGNMDTRVVHAAAEAADGSDASLAEAHRRKPRLPFRASRTGRRPFLRLVCSNHLPDASATIAEWAERIAGWLAEGHSPYVFCHTPDDRHAPQLAQALYAAIRQQRPQLPALPRFGAGGGPDPAPPRQLSLF